MSHGYCIILDAHSGVTVPTAAMRAGSHAAEQALSVFDTAMMRRLQPLAARRRSELVGADYLDSSVLDYALTKALEAAFPHTGGEPPPPLTRDCFVLRITKERTVAKADASLEHMESWGTDAIL